MQHLIRVLNLCLLSFLATSCGVKGAPIPPDPPAYLGRGEPSYQSQEDKKKNNPDAEKALEEKPSTDE